MKNSGKIDKMKRSRPLKSQWGNETTNKVNHRKYSRNKRDVEEYV